jgi:FAD/FMN-containing dehydrogenase
MPRAGSRRKLPDETNAIGLNDELALMQRLKLAHDPEGVLNPGTLVDQPQ